MEVADDWWTGRKAKEPVERSGGGRRVDARGAEASDAQNSSSTFLSSPIRCE